MQTPLKSCAAIAAIAASTLSASAARAELILIDGSSTVFPIAEAVAEEFMADNPEHRVVVGVSGTGGGFKKFCPGETAISGASRPIKQSEIDLCNIGTGTEANPEPTEFIALPVAYDALSVVVSRENENFMVDAIASGAIDGITFDQLNSIWDPSAQGSITSWMQVDPAIPGAPNAELALFAPGSDSGTFDYFTKKINGEEGASRGDYTASEDDNILVGGVSGSAAAMGYFGLAYYLENQDSLFALPISKDGEEYVYPTAETVIDGSYPLARPIYIYVNKDFVDPTSDSYSAGVMDFLEYYLTDAVAAGLMTEVGYVPLADSVYADALLHLASLQTGRYVLNSEAEIVAEPLD